MGTHASSEARSTWFGVAALVSLLLAAAVALGGCIASGSSGEAQGEDAASQSEAAQGTQSGAQEAPADQRSAAPAEGGEGAAMDRFMLTVNGQTCTVELADNETARAFAALAPLELTMRDVNGNEKFATVSGSLPGAASAPGRVEAGDLMLYGSDGIVLFYESFDTPYSYTRIGRVSDPALIATLASASSVEVTFAAQ